MIIQTQSGKLQRIDECHERHRHYQYPLLFSYGEDGYRPEVAHRGNKCGKIAKKNRIIIGERPTFRIMSRTIEALYYDLVLRHQSIDL
ncbi:hypothetical protein MTR_6g082880 [Medicago truncatula]|uniref:Uncharacterized protein n=1 Tax=Medicago truncatula TaxID=3880 RepID=A0A072UC11_MEDTR|nr:hypothetical protein MTR_6g082880 [Medicago truncatula]